MSKPTLGGASTAITLDGVEVIRSEKAANIVPLPMPTEDADKTELFDMLGVLRLIGVTGKYGRSSVASTKAFVDRLESLEDGNQTVINFVSDQTGTINVMVSSISTTWDVPGFSLTYEIKLIQGSDA